MKQKIELTSKFVLAIIIALTSVSAILVPTYATTIPNSNTTSFDDNIVNGQNIPSEEDIRNLVSGAIQNIQIVFSQSAPTTIQPGTTGDASADCPSGGTLTGGGFFSIVENLRVFRSFPLDENTWQVRAINENPSGGEEGDLVAWALCLVASTQ